MVSSLHDAEQLAAAGFSDILYVLPLGHDKIARAQPLCAAGVLQVLLDSPATLDRLQTIGAPAEDRPWRVWLKVDTGYHRAGVDVCSESGAQAALELARAIASPERGTVLAGIYSHYGSSYHCRGEEEIRAAAQREADAASVFKLRLEAGGVECPRVAVGSTPTCCHPPPAERLGAVNEMHAGNNIFFDQQQTLIGSCTHADVAMHLYARVIGAYPDRNELLMDAGWSALSSQGAEADFGFVASHPQLKILGMTQDVGKLGSVSGEKLDFAALPVGTLLRIIPYHVRFGGVNGGGGMERAFNFFLAK